MMLVGAALKGFAIGASDGKIGTVSDFLFDDTTWGIRYLIVGTRNWWPGQHVLMSPYAVRFTAGGADLAESAPGQGRGWLSPS